jgi:protein-tyrosine-phosphatase
LFVDENNGPLSRMAEAAGNRLAAPRFSFSSAGITGGAMDAQTALYLSKKGINPGQPGRAVSEALKQQYVQVVIVLCEEADRALPQKPTKTLGLRWHMTDPSKTSGSPEEIGSAYNNAFEYLDTHIRELVNAIVGQENKGANNRV